MKTCSTCRISKSLDDFYKRSADVKDGRQMNCKVCTLSYGRTHERKPTTKAQRRISSKRWRDTHVEQNLKYQREYQKRWQTAKKAARKKNEV